MRILLLGPVASGGSIPPYLDVLADALRGHGARVDRFGSPCLPYDQDVGAFWPAERIVRAAEALVSSVDLAAYDLVSVHFGNLEIEQLLPTLWSHRRRPPCVYHVHSLDWTLFTTHVPEPALRALVDDGVQSMDGLVCFGTYAQSTLRQRNHTGMSTVTWLPTTIPHATPRSATCPLRKALARRHGITTGSLYGYAAPWKDPVGLIKACGLSTNESQIVLAGPLWDDPREAGTDLTDEAAGGVHHGRIRLDVVPTYLGPCDRKALTCASDFAVFPYRPQPTFQGSGAIADYLAHGVPVLATDVANMAELIGDAGIIVPPNDPHALADGLDHLTGDLRRRRALTVNAWQRALRFTAASHAARCLRFYESIISQRAT